MGEKLLGLVFEHLEYLHRYDRLCVLVGHIRMFLADSTSKSIFGFSVEFPERFVEGSLGLQPDLLLAFSIIFRYVRKIDGHRGSPCGWG